MKLIVDLCIEPDSYPHEDAGLIETIQADLATTLGDLGVVGCVCVRRDEDEPEAETALVLTDQVEERRCPACGGDWPVVEVEGVYEEYKAYITVEGGEITAITAGKQLTYIGGEVTLKCDDCGWTRVPPAEIEINWT